MPCSSRCCWTCCEFPRPTRIACRRHYRRQRTAHYLAALERALSQHHRRLAALVIEPLVQCAAGIVVHPPGYLRGGRAVPPLRRAADCRRGGRRLRAHGHAVRLPARGRDARLSVPGQGTDRRLPAAGRHADHRRGLAGLSRHRGREQNLLSRAHLWRQFAGAAVALATLDVFDQERTLERLPAKIDRLAEHLQRIGERPHVGDVRQCGLIAGIELVRDRATREPYAWAEQRGAQVCDFARGRGVLARPLADVLVVMPPLSITADELDRILTALEAGIIAVTEGPGG